MDDLRVGHNDVRRVQRLVQILNNPFCNLLRRALQGCDGLQRPVIVVGMFIERRHIHALNLADLL